jgi:hypothetical protein
MVGSRGEPKAYRKHLISLIKNKHLHVVGLQHTTLDHVMDAAWSSDDDLGTILQSLHILTNIGSADAGMALNVHEVADSDNNFLNLLSKLTGRCKNQSLASFQVLVYLLEDGDREGGSFASSRLRLCNDVRSYIIPSVCGNLELGLFANCTFYDRHDSPLLDSRGTLETISVDTCCM